VKRILAMSFLALLAPSALLAKPVDNITQAKWADYKDMYYSNGVCTAQEVPLWSCQTQRKVFALCSSITVNQHQGYLQYRAVQNGKVIFQYPATKRPPQGLFTYVSAGNGDAQLWFSNGHYRYTLNDPLRGLSSIDVAAQPPKKGGAFISCQNSNQTLQVNYSMKLMYDAGMWDGK